MNEKHALYSAAQVRALDAEAIRLSAAPGYALMQAAAAAAWRRARERWPNARRILVFAGPGNNGGDALEVGRLALEQGKDVTLFLLARPEALRGEAASAYRAWRAVGGCEEPNLAALDRALEAADIVVDGLLGTGLDRPVAAPFKRVIQAINAAAPPVLALDLPSGLHADTGACLGLAVIADLTVSFIGRKRGLYTGQALDHVGQVSFDALDVDPATYAVSQATAWLMHAEDLRAMLPVRPRDTHKGRNGHVLLIGGAPGYSGAIRLCGQAALRAGAGLVSVLTHPESVGLVGPEQPELMVRGGDGPDDEVVSALLDQADVLALGPGLGRAKWAGSWSGLLTCSGPLVLDADALHLLREGMTVPGHCIITPHPGEAAHLLGCSTAEVQADRYAAAQNLAKRFDCVAVLKGAGSIVAVPDGRCWVCPYGNSGMAVGGMGDVLTGMIAAFLGQGLEPLQAARAGVLAHALAGDRAALDGQRGLLPTDLIAALRGIVNP